MRTILLIALLGCGCASTGAAPRLFAQAQRVEVGALQYTAMGERGQTAWAAHLVESTTPGHQGACAPRRWAPAGEPRGLVIAYHGFTACPDSMEGLGPALAAAGYEVLAPLLPGHGRAQPSPLPSGKLVDDVSDLPAREDWQRYQAFAARWADVLADARGEHAVVGLSLGGTVASLTVSARPEAVDRALIGVPFFSLSNDFVKLLLGVAAGVDALLQANPIDPVEAEWGGGCEADRRAGRGGYCSFRVRNVGAVQLAGVEARRLLLASKGLPLIELVVVDRDPAVDSALALATLNEVADRSRAGRCRACTYASTVPHSFVSPKDAPELDKPWLAPFTQAAVRFLVDGVMFPEGACPGSPGPAKAPPAAGP
ncbi:MAG TPA: alpha/beta fold hydrolase [Myxococcaceae bacterium]